MKRFAASLATVLLAFAAAAHALTAAAPTAAELYRQVLATPAWEDFSRTVQAEYVLPIEAGQLELACSRALARSTAEVSAADAPEVCMRGVLAALDRLDEYYTPAQMKTMDADATRQFVGIGIEIGVHKGDEGSILIVAPIQGAPSERAGLKPGDVIQTLEGLPTRTMTLSDAIKVMRGDAGTPLRLTVVRPGVAFPLSFAIIREPIRTRSVKAKLLGPGIGWMRISQFQDRTRDDARADTLQLERANQGPLKALVLDLRNNSGGLLDSVVGVAALTVPSGDDVLLVKGRAEAASRMYRADPSDFRRAASVTSEPPVATLKSAKLVILVSQRTAAGAEGLAETLRELRGAVVMGQPTFGIANIQTLQRLKTGGAVKVTTGLLSTPRGKSWQGTGVTPDVALVAPSAKPAEYGELPGDVELAAALEAARRP